MNRFVELSRRVVLSLEESLTGGQSFRWKKSNDQYLGVAFNILWALKQEDDRLQYKVLAELPYGSGELKIRMKVDRPKKEKKSPNSLLYPQTYYDSLLCAYFRLDIDLDKEYPTWIAAHSHFREVTKERDSFKAIRVLDQDPIENLFSFICSQNNHINRISSMVEKLATFYGSRIGEFEGIVYYSFPELEALADEDVEDNLRKNGFGYRAKFINKSAQEIIAKGGLRWFSGLQQSDYKQAHAELVTLTGIGPKVGDCICLMSLGHLSAIPVDTHIYKLAQAHYIKDLLKPMKSVTPTVYNRIGDTFREIYGPLAGWAQTILFCADLRQFQAAKPAGEGSKAKSRKRKGE